MPTLDWLNRADAFTTAARVPYRLLEPVSSHGTRRGQPADPGRQPRSPQGLLPFYRGQVKCIFIDPPYNTKSAFEHYDDNLEHSQWLSMMLPRLQLLRELLREDGSIWVTIDDNEGHYLKVLMDEVFGRRNFVANVVWQSSDNSNNDAKTFSVDHNQVLVYSRDPGWLTNKSDAEQKRSHFKNPDNDPRGPWFDGNPLNSPKPRENLMYPLTAPNGYQIPHPPNGWRWEPDTMQLKLQSGEIRFNEAMTGIKRRTYLLEMKGLPPSTLWTDLLETGHNRQAKTEQKALRDQGSPDLFDTPKPEKLLAKVLQIATQANDLVLDSFLGSGTTAAVAHKMGRRWIGIEMGEHAATHCLPRLEKVIAGEPGGISAAVGWQGGGGFRFLRLGAPIFDADGASTPRCASPRWPPSSGSRKPAPPAPPARALPAPHGSEPTTTLIAPRGHPTLGRSRFHLKIHPRTCFPPRQSPRRTPPWSRGQLPRLRAPSRRSTCCSTASWATAAPLAATC
jgi:adenine-specific DNA-methyltransferase